MNLERSAYLVAALIVCVAVAMSACSRKSGPAEETRRQKSEYGPPLVAQAPPFNVPEAGYEVEGRPGLMRNISNIKFVAWERFDGPGIPAGLQRRLLSQSPSMGAVSQITYVPPGWSHPMGYHDVDNEILVLEGDLTIDDAAGEEKLTKYSYSYMPAGEAHGLKSRQGAVLMQWWKGRPDLVESNQSREGARTYARIRGWNRYHENWYVDEPFPDYRPGGNFPGYVHTLMRKDPDTGEMTWMTFVSSIPAPPSNKADETFGGFFEIHPSFEEYYFPEGSRHADVDDNAPHKSEYGGECVEPGLSRYKNGSRGYFFRAAGVAHGGGFGPRRPVDDDGNLIGGNGDASWGWTLVRTGTRLWATYVTDCTYAFGGEYLGPGKGWRKYDYNVPRYDPKK